MNFMKYMQTVGVLMLALIGLQSAQAQLMSQPSPLVSTVANPSPVKKANQSVATAKQPIVSGPWALDEYIGEISMFIGETRVFKKPSVARLAVGNGQILSAAVTDDNEILLIANGEGTSVLHIWTKDGRSARMKIAVKASDMNALAKELSRFLATMPNVRPTVIGDKVLVEGTDLSDLEKSKLEILSKKYPQIVNFTGAVGWEKMIYMDIKVVEFKKDKLRDIGILWDKDIQGPEIGVVGEFATNKFYRIKPKLEGAEYLPKMSPFQNYFGIMTELNSRLKISEGRGDSVILAQPRLAARSGSKAEFQVGGEIPYLVVTAQTSMTEWKKYGLHFTIEPRMDNDQTVKSTLVAKVNALDPSVSTPSGIPALATRELTTEFNVRLGETMVLAGLLDRRKAGNNNGVPGLSSIPVLGELFQSNAKEERETELVIFVTPVVVSDSEQGKANKQKIDDEKAKVVDRVQIYLDPPTEKKGPMPAPCVENDGAPACF